MATFLTTAVVAMTGLSAVQGMYVQQERFPWYYGKGITRKNFFDNSVASADPSKRVRSFEPSVAKRTLISSIDFGADGRDEETRVFQGLITPGVCTDGVYIFRVTSDDASHLLLNGAVAIDNGGEHGPVTKTHARKLSDGEPVEFQLWWGNAGHGSSLRFEYCKRVKTGLKHDPLDVEEHLLGEVVRTLSDDKLAEHGCVFTTDLSGLFQKHDGPVIKRCDYKGRYYNGIDWIDERPDGTYDKFLPEMCAYEVGGEIGVDAQASGNNAAQEFTSAFTATISPRATGAHTFWVEADDGALVYVTDSAGARVKVVDNSGWHAPEWKHGSVTLSKGKQYELKVYWGNAGSTGKLRVQFEDPLTESDALSSLNPILV